MDPGEFPPGLNGRNSCTIHELLYFLPQNPLQEKAASFIVGVLKVGNVKELGIVELSIELKYVATGIGG